MFDLGYFNPGYFDTLYWGGVEADTQINDSVGSHTLSAKVSGELQNRDDKDITEILLALSAAGEIEWVA